MLLRYTVPGLVLLFAAGNAALAQDADGPKCGSFSALISLERSTFVDTSDEGASPGDQRVSFWKVHNPDGTQMGEIHSISTVLQSGEEAGSAVNTESTIVFPNGTIRASLMAVVPDASDTQRTAVESLDWSVLGGTGAFAGASGTLTTSPPEDTTDKSSVRGRGLEFNLVCAG